MSLDHLFKSVGSTKPKLAGAASGFGKGIAAGNLRLCEDGAVRVSLADDWAGLAQSLQSLGNVFATTQNLAAILTQFGRFPTFSLCACGRFATNPHGGLGFDFNAWHRVWASRRASREGACHTLTTVGLDGGAPHQILLAGEVDEEQFARFARSFQGEPGAQKHRALRGQSNGQGYLERFQFRKWQHIDPLESGAVRLHRTALPMLFEAVLMERLRITATVVSAPVIQSSLWTPTTLERRDGWLRLTAETTQLRMRLECVDEVWAVPLSVQTGGGPAVECYDAHDRLVLGLSAKGDAQGPWQGILTCLPKFQECGSIRPQATATE